MTDTREISDKYAKIAHYLINHVENLEHLKDTSIIYLSSVADKKSDGKKVLGLCEKVAEKNKWAIPCDFTITLFEPNLEGLTEEQIVMVIFHELLHVGADEDSPHTIPHDLEDFRMMIELFGANWSEPGTKSLHPEITEPAAAAVDMLYGEGGEV